MLAWIVNNVLSAMGGFTVNRLPFNLTPWGDLHNDLPALWKVLQIFGADPIQLSGAWLALAILRIASLLVVGWALARVARHFYAASLADQVLAAAIVLNVVLYLLTNASDEAAHEVAIIVPFGAALAARMLIRPAQPGRGAGAVTAETAGSRTISRRVRASAWAAGIVVLAGYTAGLGWELTQPTQPPANTQLAAWLASHHLTYGLSGYWTSSSVTVDSGQRVKVRALMQYTLQKDLWMSDQRLVQPGAALRQLRRRPGQQAGQLLALGAGPAGQEVLRHSGRTYHIGPYTILVWHKNLLKDIPRRTVTPKAPSQLSMDRLKPGPRPARPSADVG